ncbi:MAG: hypothetical protein A2754_00155 [Candidatus Magasanikbacteria bacterium RIFCSPHIGHO2_01_FULL_47_8]|uniref:Uncharacterized protein n=1 Tax=Candidatus Magasanikbacteria bacterium RIFCSPHIGHO2_01_FULL_47_8 TaxID=1798673 RepID=A0A1F6MAT5_9BACT|nr:MAG: hypothetical protein A2754_00155 [Candidatus Magasanikbacteria bacterium RIFCSPHIGHO2_01_FULL_47_8]
MEYSDQQQNDSFKKPAQGLKNILPIIISIAATTLVISGAIFVRQKFVVEAMKKNWDSKEKNLEQQITALNNQITQMQQKQAYQNVESAIKNNKDPVELKVAVTGYPIITEVPEAWCEENCKTYSYVLFKIVKANNNALFAFLGVNEGNSFVGKESVGLGCTENNVITYFNHSDQFGMQEYRLSLELSKKILEANQEKPITIQLERLLFTGGSGAPTCYSHFTRVSSAE